MDIEVERNPLSVLSRIPEIVELADTVKEAFGFLPPSAYEQQANKERLWLALDPDTKDIAGYLLFGGTFPYLKVFQVFVSPDYMRQGIGRALVSELEQFADQNNYLYISAKVATELPANKFWQSLGFRICDQIPAEGKKRTKNIYVLELKNTSLFTSDTSQSHRFEYGNTLQLRNMRFVLDLNVYFDAVKQREYSEDALRVFRLGMTGRVKLNISAEFLNELKRNSPDSGPDPLLELAGAFPKLPDIPHAAKTKLLDSLRQDIFPNRSLVGRTAVQDASDLAHLAICVHYGADGFVTREKAILQKSGLLRRKYGLDIVSPSDLLEAEFFNDSEQIDIAVVVSKQPLSIASFSELDRDSTVQFLMRFGLGKAQANDIVSPQGQTSHQPCRVAKADGKIVGLLAIYQLDLGTVMRAHVYVDEPTPESARIIDHFFKTLEISQVSQRLTYTDLYIPPRQQLTYETAVARGYRKTDASPPEGLFRLGKWAYRGPLCRMKWEGFREEFAAVTKIQLAPEMPSFPELENTGILVRSNKDDSYFSISLREFESLTSTFLIASERPYVIIPIRYGYASQLLEFSMPQRELGFDKLEAILRSERCYFCRPPVVKALTAGAIVMFYVSGHKGGNKALVGIARVTSVQKIDMDSAATKLGRQGVLSKADLARTANSLGEVVAITFDNYLPFKNEVSWTSLKELGCIGGANLVKSQATDTSAIESILELAFGGN